jgi:hypothetical protein
LAAVPASLFGQGIAIDHKPVGCIVAEKYPQLSACFAPPGKLARARVYFRAETGGPNWFYVDTKFVNPCHAGVLPKPKKSLIGKRVFYYIDAFDQQLMENRTPDNAAEVVANERDCKKDLPIAAWLPKASVTVFPSLPAEFALGGGTAVAALAVGGAAVVGGGVAVAVAAGGSDSTTTTTIGGGGPPPPVTSPTTTVTTTTTLPPTGGTPFEPDFRINPNPPIGTEPLIVEFNMCRSRGTDLKFTFDFDGDGVEDFRGQCRAVRTFRLTGVSASGGVLAARTATYRSVMRVFEPSDSARPPENDASQTNNVIVNEAGPPPTTLLLGIGRSTEERGAPKLVATRRLAWVSHLDIPGASGQVVVNGTTALFTKEGRSSGMALGRKGDNRIEAQVVQGSVQGGTWRFELGSTASLEPGSLRVVAGAVAMVSGDAIVFRLSGRAGERVVFTFRTSF